MLMDLFADTLSRQVAALRPPLPPPPPPPPSPLPPQPAPGAAPASAIAPVSSSGSGGSSSSGAHAASAQHPPALHQAASSASGAGPAAAVVRRLHFHEFMLAVHTRLHQLQQALPRVVGRSRQGLQVYRWGGAGWLGGWVLQWLGGAVVGWRGSPRRAAPPVCGSCPGAYSPFVHAARSFLCMCGVWAPRACVQAQRVAAT